MPSFLTRCVPACLDDVFIQGTPLSFPFLDPISFLQSKVSSHSLRRLFPLLSFDPSLLITAFGRWDSSQVWYYFFFFLPKFAIVFMLPVKPSFRSAEGLDFSLRP